MPSPLVATVASLDPEERAAATVAARSRYMIDRRPDWPPWDELGDNERAGFIFAAASHLRARRGADPRERTD